MLWGRAMGQKHSKWALRDDGIKDMYKEPKENMKEAMSSTPFCKFLFRIFEPLHCLAVHAHGFASLLGHELHSFLQVPDQNL